MEKGLMEFDGPRTPSEDEADDVRELIRFIFFKNSPTFQDAARTWPMGLRAEARENCFAMFHDGKPVSAIARLERDIVIYGHTLRIGYVGNVCTHPDYRNLGLASTVLSATMKRFHENNVDFVCISGNRRMYQDAGSRVVGGLNRFILKRGSLDQFSDGKVSLKQAELQDAKTLSKLNEMEPIRSVRPVNDYELVLNYGHCVGRKVNFFISYYKTLPSAYLLITELMERDEGKFRRVMEYAGDRYVILSTLNELLKDLPSDANIEIDVQVGDPLEALLSPCGIIGTPASRPGTLCVIDFNRTMRKLKPFFASILPSEVINSIDFSSGRGRYNAWCKDGMLKIEGETNMVWTVLGAPPGEVLSNVSATGYMKDLIEQCLPVPLPPLEMNMI